MRFLFGLADFINVIHWGQVIARGTPAELRANHGCNVLRSERSLVLNVRAIDTYYGESQVLFGVSCG